MPGEHPPDAWRRKPRAPRLADWIAVDRPVRVAVLGEGLAARRYAAAVATVDDVELAPALDAQALILVDDRAPPVSEVIAEASTAVPMLIDPVVLVSLGADQDSARGPARPATAGARGVAVAKLARCAPGARAADRASIRSRTRHRAVPRPGAGGSLPHARYPDAPDGPTAASRLCGSRGRSLDRARLTVGARRHAGIRRSRQRGLRGQPVG